MSSDHEVRVKQEVHDMEYHVKLEVEETDVCLKLEVEEMDHLLKLKSSEFLESMKAKQVFVETFIGYRHPSDLDKWSISYPNWAYTPVHHGLYTYQRAPEAKKSILVVIQKKVDCIFLSELVSHSIELLDIYHKAPIIVVMCLEDIDNQAKILLTKTKKGAYMASGSFWKNAMFVLTPELIPHGNSSMEKLVAQQFYKFKQSHN